MSFIIIHIDHFVAIFIFKQIILITNNTNKFNLRLIRTFQYFFNFNIFIRYKFDKLFTSQNSKNKINIFDVLYENSIELSNYELVFVII